MSKIYKSLIFNGEVSLSIIDSTDIVNAAIGFHKLSPLAAAGLGRSLTATVFMASLLKNADDRLSVTINGNGVGGHIITSADSELNVRGSIDFPSADLPLNSAGKLDVAGLVGTGYMTVVKSLGLKEPYVGRCRIVSGEIAEDFAAYYAYSEQQPTAMALGVLIGKNLKCEGAGGVVLQPMPGASEESISAAEELIGKFGDVSRKISEGGAEKIISDFFSGYSFDVRECRYRCNCSKDYIDGVLLTIGRDELYDTVKAEGKVEVCCHFCDKKYVYSEEDIKKLFEDE